MSSVCDGDVLGQSIIAATLPPVPATLDIITIARQQHNDTMPLFSFNDDLLPPYCQWHHTNIAMIVAPVNSAESTVFLQYVLLTILAASISKLVKIAEKAK